MEGEDQEYAEFKSVTNIETQNLQRLQSAYQSTIAVVKKIGLNAKNVGNEYSTSNPSVRQQIVDVTRDFVATSQAFLLSLQAIIDELKAGNNVEKLTDLHHKATEKRQTMLDAYKFLLTLLSVWDNSQTFKNVGTPRGTRKNDDNAPLKFETNTNISTTKAGFVSGMAKNANTNPTNNQRTLASNPNPNPNPAKSPNLKNELGMAQQAMRAGFARTNKTMLGVQRVTGPVPQKQETTTSVATNATAGKRLYSHLWIVVAEGRNLPKMDVGGECDPYVTIAAGEHATKTRTIWKERKNPFWGEDFEFEIKEPDLLKSVKFTVFDSEKLGKDEVIGHIIVPIETLRDQKVHEQFHPIVGLESKDYIAGDIKLSGSIVTNSDSTSSLKIHVFEGRNLAAKDANGLSDPYVTISIGKQKKKSKVVKKDLNPKWNEDFAFTLTSQEASNDLIISIWDWDRIGAPDFMGQITLNPKLIPKTESWLVLSSINSTADSESGDSKPTGSPSTPVLKKGRTMDLKRKVLNSSESSLGDIRIKIKFTQEMLLPLESYSELKEFILTNQNIISYLYENSSAEKEQLAKILVNIFSAEGKVTYLLDLLINKEIKETDNAEIIFRGNSLTTKSVDAFMKLSGSKYLIETLKPVITDINKDKRSTEVDPMKVEKSENADKNMELLKSRISEAFLAITNSKSKLPEIFKIVFANLAKRVKEKFGNLDDVKGKYPAIAGFLFLRFFNPAILGPKLFDLADQHPDQRASRTFTLISKTLQNLANLVSFGEKEKYMIPLNSFIEQNKGPMKQFLDYASTTTTTETSSSVGSGHVDMQKELAGLGQLLKQYLPIMQQKYASDTATISKLTSILNKIYS